MTIQIVAFEPRHREVFRDLNLAWIEEYFEVEDLDREILGNPESSVLAPGGTILVAQDDDDVIGVCALLYESDRCYEVAKMAVRADRRGAGIGRKLLAAVIAHARAIGASSLSIVSNRSLEAALALYLSFGFLEVSLPDGFEYERANIALRLELS